MNLRRFFYIGGAFLLVLMKFIIDVVGKNVELGWGGIAIARELLALVAFALVFLASNPLSPRPEQNPVRKLGVLLVGMVAVVLLSAIFGSIGVEGFDAKDRSLLPLDYPTLFFASLLGILFGLYATMILRQLQDLILTHRKKGTLRNFLVFLGLAGAVTLAAMTLRPLETSLFNSILFALAIAAAVVNAFRLPWIVYLSKREKIYGLVFSFFLFAGATVLNVIIAQSATVGRSLLYYSYPLREFIQIVMVFGNVYFGMTFVSTLFHLPTAEAFERKRSEVTSLYNLSKLVTQVFDFEELVDTVTTMTLQVCEAKSSWLEVIHPGGTDSAGPGPPATGAQRASFSVQVAGKKNITQEQIDEILPLGSGGLRDAVLAGRAPIVVDDVASDPRFAGGKVARRTAGSIVVVPLVSHSGLIGLLYATKDRTFGFMKDDVEVISAFADQATVAIENSRLIKTSIERERLLREMMLAQEMQRKLLPQSVPVYPSLDIDAVSTPAFEVGGDYYDFMQLNPTTVGVIVGDVSGKGVSAALYMSEVKGVFQALGRMYASPREFMIRANDALSDSMDKHSFVSLLYATLDMEQGKVTVARAGHCPLLHCGPDGSVYVRPDGMGIGLSDGHPFVESMEEQVVEMRPGDVCVLFTDGVTEARHGGDEFGYDRLRAVAERVRDRSATMIKDEILGAVQTFIGHQAAHDDLTVVVVKWHGPASRNPIA